MGSKKFFGLSMIVVLIMTIYSSSIYASSQAIPMNSNNSTLHTQNYMQAQMSSGNDKIVKIEEHKKKLEEYKNSRQKEICEVLDKQVSEQGPMAKVGGQNKDISIKSYSFKDAYKVNLMSHMIITGYNKHHSFTSLLTDAVQWVVPVYNSDGEIGYTKLAENGNQIKWLGTSFGDSQQSMQPDTDSIFEKIETISSEGIKTIQFAYSQYYNITFVYFDTMDQKYIIPFSPNSKSMKFDNGEVYTVDNIFKILNGVFDESIIDGNSNGGLPYRTHSIPLYLIIVIGISLIAIILCLRFINHKNFKKIS